MWWQLFIVLVATAAATEDEDETQSPDCMSLMYHECEPKPGEKAPDFPSNGEELQEFCEFALKYFDCVDSVLSNCPEEDTVMIRFERETAAAVRRLCNEDPLLRAAVASILPCFEENRRKIGRCEDAFGLDRESFSEIINLLEITDIDELDDSGRRCSNILYNYGCIAATSGMLCGDVARDIVVDILQGFEAPLEICPAGVKDRIPDIADVMQIEAEKVNSVEEKLKKKK